MKQDFKPRHLILFMLLLVQVNFLRAQDNDA
jgi:hypothetical protein